MNFLRSIKGRLFALLLSLCAAQVTVGGLGYLYLERMGGHIGELAENIVPKLTALNTLNESGTAMIWQTQRSLHGLLEGQLGRVKRGREAYEAARRDFESAWADFEKLPRNAEEEARWKAFVAAHRTW